MDSAVKLEIIKVLKTKLDDYIQKKADFLAEITTEPLASTKPAYLFREVILPFVTNTLLMDNLATNEGIGYTDVLHNRLSIHVFVKNAEMSLTELKATYSCSRADGQGEPPHYIYPNDMPYTLHCLHEDRTPPGEKFHVCKIPSHGTGDLQNAMLQLVAPIEGGDLEVELPGPLGEFALYAILENLIRNAAKHNKTLFEHYPDKHLELTIRVFDDPVQPNDYYRLQVYDNVTQADKSLLDEIAAYIKMPVIEGDGEMKRKAWGLAETKICATLLAGSNDFQGMERNLSVEAGDEPEKSLVYGFRLMKPQRLCALVQSGTLIGDKAKLARAGIVVHTSLSALNDRLSIQHSELTPPVAGAISPLSALTDKLSNQHSMAAFRFFLLDGEHTDLATNPAIESLLGLLPRLPFRVLIIGGSASKLPRELQEKLDCRAATFVPADEVPSTLWQENPQQIMQWIWQCWLRGRLDKEETAVVEVYLDQEAAISPSKEWSEYALRRQNSPNDPIRLRFWTKGGPRGNQPELPSKRRHIFFDRHAGAIDASTPAEGRFLGHDCYILIDKLNADYVKLFQTPPSEEKAIPQESTRGNVSSFSTASSWTLPYELAEAGLMRVLIVDERLSERCLSVLDTGNTNVSKVSPMFSGLDINPTIWHLAFGAKVFICTHLDIDLPEGNTPRPLHGNSYRAMEDERKAQQALLPFLKWRVQTKTDASKYQCSYEWAADWLPIDPEERITRTDDLKPDMLIIHLGILDEIKNTYQIDPCKFLEEIGRCIPFVVVDSGRGIPPTLPNTAKFLPFSILNDYVAGTRTAKYSLIKQAMDLTRRRRIL